MKLEYISPSRIGTLHRCGEQYRRRYIEGERTPPGIAMIRGRSQHHSQEVNLTHKMETGELLPVEQVIQVAADKFDVETRADWEVGAQYEGLGPEDAKGQAKDDTLILAKLHATQMAPQINPTAIEVKFEIPPSRALHVGIVGVIDLVDDGRKVRDTKTVGKSPGKSDADQSGQLTAYGLAFHARYGKPVEALTLDCLVRTPKGKTSVVVQETTRDEGDYIPWIQRARAAVRMIEAEVFLPAPQDGPASWVCSEKWCGFHATCPYVRGINRPTS